jgi:RNA polymerase sigma factor (sigma-70 family)
MPSIRPRKRAKQPRAAPIRLEKLSDAEIVALCAGGDEAAWRALVLRYRRLVYTIPYRMGLDPDDSDEVSQVAWVRLAQRIGRIREPARVRAWLVTTARRAALNVVGRRRDAATEMSAELTDPADLPSEEIERLEQQQLVRIALAQLDRRCRDLLSLLYYPDERSTEPASYDAVAKKMGIAPGSVGPTRLRCLKKLLVQYRKLQNKQVS